MGIVDLLRNISSTSMNQQCLYNGYLRDYIQDNNNLNTVVKEVYEKVLEYFSDTCICVGLNLTVDPNIIPNQIIRYKDINKLNGKGLRCNDILYLQMDDQQKALIYSEEKLGSYIMVKGTYLLMSEPGSDYVNYRNDIVSISSDDAYEVVNTITDLFTKKAGAIQRSLEHKRYKNFDQLYQDALSYGESISEKARVDLPLMSYRDDYISQIVMTWFLLKKVCYVTYMLDKRILETVYHGDSKQQRTAAKHYADTIKFIPYSELWRMGESS